MHHKEIEMQEQELDILGRPLSASDESSRAGLAHESLEEASLLGPFHATDYMKVAAEQMEDRAASRDQEDGERSMARAVAAFNTIYGRNLTETEGWQFMSILKKARGAVGAYREDDYVDDIAYAALAAESAGKEQD